jgi:hypothetical protein
MGSAETARGDKRATAVREEARGTPSLVHVGLAERFTYPFADAVHVEVAKCFGAGLAERLCKLTRWTYANGVCEEARWLGHQHSGVRDLTPAFNTPIAW